MPPGREQGAEGCYRKPVVMLLPSSSSFIFLLMFPSLLVSLPPFHLSILLWCVCSCVHSRLCVSLRVGVGDKTDSQHHCVYKAPVCCRLWAYHSSAQHLRTISHACARVCVCMCALVKEKKGASERGTEGSGCTVVKLREVDLYFSYCGGTSISHQKIPPKTHRGR